MKSDISVRALIPNDWQTFRAVRLKALQENSGVYLSSYEKEIKTSESQWKDMLDGNGKCLFGLFDGNKPIGLAAVFTWREDPRGESGVMAMDYVDAHYRGRHLSKLLYEARINWAINHLPFQRLVISHREGNEASRRAIQAFGFKFTDKRIIDWPDGSNAREYNYELDLRSLRQVAK
jgi:RimJ/RimL family protein N-acetyltransferase